MKNLRGAKPIPNPTIKKFITDFKRTELIYDEMVLDKFKNRFVNWIKESGRNEDYSFVSSGRQSINC